jgi:hypothetical protein
MLGKAHGICRKAISPARGCVITSPSQSSVSEATIGVKHAMRLSG